jgi:Transposase DDE domain
MVFQAIIEQAAKKLPITAMLRSLLEHCLNATILDELFEEYRRLQYTRDILFSTIVRLLSLAVCKVRPSPNAAVMSIVEELKFSKQSLWDKINGTDPEVSAALVRTSAARLEALIDGFGPLPPSLIPGYETLILDGNCIKASEHRLKELRKTASGPLPGKVLAILDARRRLVRELIPSLDGHAQERSLLPEIYKRMSAGQLWVGDRNFCTTEFFAQAQQRGAFVILREHKSLPWTRCSEPTVADSSGKLFEESIQIPTSDGSTVTARRIVVHLDEPTRDGDWYITLITTLPQERAPAALVADQYAKRWSIEAHFNMMSRAFDAEIPTMGYPKAAFLALAVGFVAANIVTAIHAAIQAAHPEIDAQETVSKVRIAEEVQCTYGGMMALTGPEAWEPFQTLSESEMIAWLLRCAAQVPLPRFRKATRGPKKPRPKRSLYRGSPHVSTARLLQQATVAP